MTPEEEMLQKIEQITQGGPERYRQRAKAEGRLLVRERLSRLARPRLRQSRMVSSPTPSDEGNAADAVITGMGKIDGRTRVFHGQ